MHVTVLRPITSFGIQLRRLTAQTLKRESPDHIGDTDIFDALVLLREYEDIRIVWTSGMLRSNLMVLSRHLVHIILDLILHNNRLLRHFGCAIDYMAF